MNKLMRMGAGVVLLSGLAAMPLQAQNKLTGIVIGTEQSVDYATGQPSTTVNTAAMAHDGDLSTYFASYERKYTWTGLDLGAPYIITKVGWSPRNDGKGEERVVLGMFQGANSPDFMDAVPLYIITERGTIGKMDYAEVNCSKGFRYVRYMGTSDTRCNIAEVEFYGTAGEGDDSKFYQITNLPLVVINTANMQEPYDKEHDIVSNIIVISKNGTDKLEKSGTSRLRGNASMQFEKKPYRIKFDKKQSLPGAPAKAKKWTLINNYGDKSLMRNIVAFEVSRRSGLKYTPFCQAVDVVLNGEYKGNYQLCDQVEVNPDRVAITEMTPEDIADEALTGGYFLEVDGYADQEISWFNSTRGIPVTIKSPDDDEIVPAQKEYIRNYFNKMESLVYNTNATGETYADIVDVPSFIKHFLVGEFSGNTDTYWSTYIYKDRSDAKMYFGPVWDFDIAFDNDYRTYPLNNKSDYVYRSGGSSAGSMNTFVTLLLNRQEVTAQVESEWGKMRDNGFSEKSMCAYIDSIATDLDASQRLNFMRWKMLGNKVHMNPVVYGTYAEYVNALKNYVIKRIEWLDKKLHYTPSESAIESATDQNVSVYVMPNGEVVVHGSRSEYAVYDITGHLCAQGSSATPVRLTREGIYVVSVAGKAFKVAF